MDRYWRISASLVLIAFAGMPPAWAQEDDDDRPTRYEVEVIVFRHLDQSANTPEVPPPPVADRRAAVPAAAIDTDPRELAQPGEMVERPIQAETDPLDLAAPGAGVAEIAAEPRAKPIDFYLLESRAEMPDFLPVEPERLELDRTYGRLARLEIYEPLLHLGWTQQARSRADARPYEMAHPDARRAGVTGTVMLYKERFLHLKLDLSLDPAPNPEPAELQEGFAIVAEGNWDEPATTIPIVYRLEESRRIRGEEAQYFDHPQFGVIASIREIKPAEETPPETG